MRLKVIFNLFILILLIQCRPKQEKVAYVNANGGLRLRSKPTIKSTKVVLIPDKSKVLIIGTEKKADTIDGFNGSWVQVKFKQSQGWAFDKYLTSDLNAKQNVAGTQEQDSDNPFAAPDKLMQEADKVTSSEAIKIYQEVIKKYGKVSNALDISYAHLAQEAIDVEKCHQSRLDPVFKTEAELREKINKHLKKGDYKSLSALASCDFGIGACESEWGGRADFNSISKNIGFAKYDYTNIKMLDKENSMFRYAKKEAPDDYIGFFITKNQVKPGRKNQESGYIWYGVCESNP